MIIKRGQRFKCIKTLKVAFFILFEEGKEYVADRDGSIDGVDHGIVFEEYFEPVCQEN